MRATGGDAIVDMASVMSQVGFPNISAYVAAKHGVLGLTRAAAIDHAGEAIRINAVGPTFILTDLVKSTMDMDVQQFLADNHPVRRLGAAEEVAELVAWLVSDASSLVDGSFHPSTAAGSRNDGDASPARPPEEAMIAGRSCAVMAALLVLCICSLRVPFAGGRSWNKPRVATTPVGRRAGSSKPRSI